jgi:hypothetical protein
VNLRGCSFICRYRTHYTAKFVGVVAHTLVLLLACSAAVGLQNSAAARSGAKPKQAYPAGVSHRIPSGPVLAADQRAHYSLQAGVDCATCTAFATLAQDIAENATELADIVAALDVVCKDLSPNDNTTYALCAAVVKDAMNILPWVNTQLTMLACPTWLLQCVCACMPKPMLQYNDRPGAAAHCADK